MGKLSSAFISYSTDASIKAKQVSNQLSTIGVDSFIFEKDLSAKKGNKQARIRTEISKRDAVVRLQIW